MKTLVIISSVINPIDKPLSYTATRNIYTAEERYIQTLQTIQSVREKLPNSYIALLECSGNIEKFENQPRRLIEDTDEYYNYYEDQIARKDVESEFKGLGEVTILLKFLKNTDLSRFGSLFKLSGRYYLNDTFNINAYENDDNIFKYFPQCAVVSTRFFKIGKFYFNDFIDNLEESRSFLKNGKGMEATFCKLIYPFKHIDNLGVSGNIAVDGTLIEE